MDVHAGKNPLDRCEIFKYLPDLTVCIAMLGGERGFQAVRFPVVAFGCRFSTAVEDSPLLRNSWIAIADSTI
jgi:hypothetical protein